MFVVARRRTRSIDFDRRSSTVQENSLRELGQRRAIERFIYTFEHGGGGGGDTDLLPLALADRLTLGRLMPRRDGADSPAR